MLHVGESQGVTIIRLSHKYSLVQIMNISGDKKNNEESVHGRDYGHIRI